MTYDHVMAGARAAVGGLVLSMILVACSSSTGVVYDAARSISSLQGAGWAAKSAAGMPGTLSGLRQVGYLETRAPSGTRIDIQFFEDASSAEQELTAVQHSDASFIGSTIGNSLVFGAGPKTAVPKSCLDSLRKLLRS